MFHKIQNLSLSRLRYLLKSFNNSLNGVHFWLHSIPSMANSDKYRPTVFQCRWCYLDVADAKNKPKTLLNGALAADHHLAKTFMITGS